MKYGFCAERYEEEFVMPFAVPVRLPESQILCNIVAEAWKYSICQLSLETLD